MDESRARKVVNESIEPMRRAMGLEYWKLFIHYGAMPLPDRPASAVFGATDIDPDYHEASITIDPACHPNDAAVLETLRHELLHVMHSEFQLVWKIVREHLGEESKEFAAYKAVHKHAQERLVERLERLLDTNKIKPSTLVCRGKPRSSRKSKRRR